MSVWEEEGVKKWVSVCRKEQEQYAELLGQYKWREYKHSEYRLFKSNIGYSFCGPPEKEQNFLNEYLGYDDKQMKLINEVFDLVMESKKVHMNKGTIWASLLFVSGKMNDTLLRCAVLRIPKYDVGNFREEHLFIDMSRRVYDGWEDYLNNNKLPDCLMCYPCNGVYKRSNGVLMLGHGVSPAGSVGQKVLTGFDITACVTSLAGAGVCIAALFVPMAAPFVWSTVGVNVASGAYQLGRSIATLVDRGQHQQTISYNSSEARNCWVGIAGGALGIASVGAIAVAARAVQAGETLTLAGITIMKTVTGTSCAVNALGIVNGITNIVQKVVQKEEVSALDILQLTSSILFFTGSVISTHQAHTLLNRMSQSNSYRTNWLNEISNYVKNMKGSGGVGSITNFSILAFGFTGNKFFTVSKEILNKLAEITKKLWKKLITLAEYTKKAWELLDKMWESFSEEISFVVYKTCELLGAKHWAGPIVEGLKLASGRDNYFMNEFAAVLTHEMYEFQRIMTPPGPDDTSSTSGTSMNHATPQTAVPEPPVVSSYLDESLEVITEFARMEECQDSAEFIRYCKFVCKFIRREFQKSKEEYQKMLAFAKRFNPQINITEFDREYGIMNNEHEEFFLKKALNQFKNKDGFFKLKLAYEDENEVTVAQEATESSSFIITDEANHSAVFLNIEGQGEDGSLSTEQYKEIATKISGESHFSIEDYNGFTHLTVPGTSSTVLVRSFVQNGRVSGLVTYIPE